MNKATAAYFLFIFISAVCGFSHSAAQADDNAATDYPLDFKWLSEIRFTPGIELGAGAVIFTGSLSAKFTYLENQIIENSFSSISGFNLAAGITGDIRTPNIPIGIEFGAGYKKIYMSSGKTEINAVPTYLQHTADFACIAAIVNVYPKEFPLNFGLGMVYYFPLNSHTSIIGDYKANGADYKRTIPADLPEIAGYTSLCFNTDWDLGINRNIFGLKLAFKPFLNVIADIDAISGNSDGLKGYAVNLGLALMPE